MRYGRDYERGFGREDRYGGPRRYEEEFRRGDYNSREGRSRDLRSPSNDFDPGFGGYPRRRPEGEPGWGDAGWRASRRFRPGVYGEDYPVFTVRDRGMPQGRETPQGRSQDREFGNDRSRGFRGGYEPQAERGPFGRSDRYDRDFRNRSPQRYETEYAREPFLPERAYQRHPELEEAPEQHDGEWPGSSVAVAQQAGSSDEELTQAVRENLHRDVYVSAEGIEVSVAAGVVTLRGEVGDYMEARYAWDDAWEAEGVRGVLNQLTVRTDRPDPESTGEAATSTE